MLWEVPRGCRMATLCSLLDSWARPLRSLGSPSRYFPTAPKSTYYKVRLMSTDRIEWQACTAGYPNEKAMGSPGDGSTDKSPGALQLEGQVSALWQVLSRRSGCRLHKCRSFIGTGRRLFPVDGLHGIYDHHLAQLACET